MTDLLRQWKNDFGFVSVDDWQNMDRSSESAFLNTAEQLDRAFIDQIDHFTEDEFLDRQKVHQVAVMDRQISAYQHNIGAVDRYLEKYGTSLAAAKEERDRLIPQLTALQSLQEKYRLLKDRNQFLAVEALSVYLPKKAVKLDVDTVKHYRRLAPIPLEGEVYPFVDKSTPNLAVIPPWTTGEFDNQYLGPAAAAVPPAKGYHQPIPQAPEEAVAVLGAEEGRAVQAFRARNDYDQAHPEHLDYDSKSAEVARLYRLQTEKMNRLTEILDQRKQVYPALNALRVNVKSAAVITVKRVAESLIWEVAKNMAIEKCKKAVADTFHRETTQLYLPEAEIFDKYNNHLFNVFNLPKTVFRVKEVKAVQNDIMTLLTQDQKYAKTAVRLAATGDQAEIKAFVDGMFSKLDEDGTKLIDDALSASSTMPEPVRTLASRYFSKSFRDKPAEGE